jgi:hypothetical protein
VELNFEQRKTKALEDKNRSLVLRVLELEQLTQAINEGNAQSKEKEKGNAHSYNDESGSAHANSSSRGPMAADRDGDVDSHSSMHTSELDSGSEENPYMVAILKRIKTLERSQAQGNGGTPTTSSRRPRCPVPEGSN